MRISDTPEGQGRAASDTTLLLLLTILAVETKLVVSVFLMLRYGEWQAAISTLVGGARDLLAMPVVVLLGGSVLLTLSAGRRRRPADDFDLTCVALTPLVLLELVNALLIKLGLDLKLVLVYIGYSWFAALLVVAYRQTRRRERRTS